jgi:hypothetical protein
MPLSMGVINFLVPRHDRLAPDAIDRAYFSGLDEIPWRTRVQWTDVGLTVERAESDSGNLFIPYRVNGHGELMLSTASLMERAQPYHLQVELARGTLNRLRNQLSAWETLGMTAPSGMRAPLVAAHEHLSWAATRQDESEVAADRATLAIAQVLDAMRVLSDSYVTQALAARHHQLGRLNTLLGINLGNSCPSEAIARQVVPAFNTAVVPLNWRYVETREGKRDWTLSDQQIEWCRARGLKVCSGPLLEIDKWSLPDWMYLWGEDDEESFRACVVEQIQAVVTRYRGKVHLWQCAAGLNTNNDFAQNEEERLRLAVLTIETIRRADPRAPVIITVDQPWGSFMSREDCDLSPLHFADALVRGDLGLAGIGLEINLGYAPSGSEPRDLLEFGRQMDRWSTLGLPLLVTLNVPSDNGADPLARSSSRPLLYADSERLSSTAQRTWAEEFLPMLLAKQPVQGIIWNQLLDSQPHAFAHGGLFDAQDLPKPILEFLASLRRQHLA